jgi:hypothetical protein
MPCVHITPYLNQDAMLCSNAGADHHGRGSGQSERAWAGYNNNGDAKEQRKQEAVAARGNPVGRERLRLACKCRSSVFLPISLTLVVWQGRSCSTHWQAVITMAMPKSSANR